MVTNWNNQVLLLKVVKGKAKVHISQLLNTREICSYMGEKSEFCKKKSHHIVIPMDLMIWIVNRLILHDLKCQGTNVFVLLSVHGLPPTIKDTTDDTQVFSIVKTKMDVCLFPIQVVSCFHTATFGSHFHLVFCPSVVSKNLEGNHVTRIHTCHIFLGPFWDFWGNFLGQMSFFWDKYCKILGHFLWHF